MYDKLQKQLHGFAEPGYQEYKSASLLEAFLEDNGFTVEKGVADTLTAFVATFGSDHPAIGAVTLSLEEDRAVTTLYEQAFFFPGPLQEGEQKPALLAEMEREHKGSICVFPY